MADEESAGITDETAVEEAELSPAEAEIEGYAKKASGRESLVEINEVAPPSEDVASRRAVLE